MNWEIQSEVMMDLDQLDVKQVQFNDVGINKVFYVDTNVAKNVKHLKVASDFFTGKNAVVMVAGSGATNIVPGDELVWVHR